MKSIFRLFRHLKPYWKMAGLALLFLLFQVALDLLVPRLLQNIVDVGIANQDLSYVVNQSLMMIGLALVAAGAAIANTIYSVRASQNFGADLRNILFRKVQTLSFVNLDSLDTGKLVTRLTSDVDMVQRISAMSLRIMTRAPILLLGSLIMLVITAPSLVWIPLVVFPVAVVILAIVIGRGSKLFQVQQERLDGVNTVMQESLSGVRVVKAFVREDYENERFGAANSKLRDSAIKVGQLLAFVPPIIMIVMNLALIAVFWFGGLHVIQGTLTLGELTAFLNYLSMTLNSLMMLSMLLMAISRGEASAQRICKVLDEVPTVVDPEKPITKLLGKGRVEFDHVTFNYDGDEAEPALKDVSFVAEPGQMVAILGATGSGKSTLVHLIPRFYDVTGGAVLLDGTDIRDVSQKTLRAQISMSLQEAILFSGTIRDNIRYGRRDASEKEIVAAAQAAQADDFIMSLPDGYDTLVGQRGVNLSGGQKQRLAIARAILANPTVLILDDSTSAVDVDTEAKIQDALTKIMKDRTSFVVAQRISTVLAADKILVLDEGRLVAEGTHSELMASSQVYREIYESQLGNGVSVNA